MSIKRSIQISSTLWKYQASTSAWYFLSCSVTDVERLLGHAIPKRHGWGQIRVQVTIGTTAWKTSLFPSKEHGYDLPIKASVRTKENLIEGDIVEATIVIC